MAPSAAAGPAPPRRPPPPRLVGQPEGDGGHQVERPVVAVEQQPGDGGHRHQVPGPGPAQGPVEGQEPQDGEQGHQGVHPGLGVVADGERRGGHQQRGGPRRRCARPAGARPATPAAPWPPRRRRTATGRPGRRCRRRPSRSGGARRRAAGHRPACREAGSSWSGSRAMLTVSASSSHRSDRVQKRRTSATTRTTAVAPTSTDGDGAAAVGGVRLGGRRVPGPTPVRSVVGSGFRRRDRLPPVCGRRRRSGPGRNRMHAPHGIHTGPSPGCSHGLSDPTAPTGYRAVTSRSKLSGCGMVQVGRGRMWSGEGGGFLW